MSGEAPEPSERDQEGAPTGREQEQGSMGGQGRADPEQAVDQDGER